ncbi:MAG: LOG family protein [Planctomycetota bacterium]
MTDTPTPPETTTHETTPARTGDAETIAHMDRLLEDAGVRPNTLQGKRLRSILHTALKLQADEATTGEVKLISQSLKELRYALKVFRPYKDTPKISIFGSARTPETHPDYLAAVDFAKQMANAGWMVITGAGDGIMRAGHHGADRQASFGVSIQLPFETNANDIIEGDSKLINFRYFFTRKLTFMWQSAAVALFPGGFGTQDEGFEALTLIQTGKAPLVPIVLIEPKAEDGGAGYWTHWDNYVKKSLLNHGWISPEDLSLYAIFNDTQAAVDHVLQFYRNYHSQRFIRDRFVLRLHRPLTQLQLETLTKEFTGLIAEGKIEQHQGPLPEERGEYPDLVRLHWHSTKRAYGQLRQLIDRANAFDQVNTA